MIRTPPLSISRRDIRKDPDGFHALFAAAIARVQALSGTLWTDYNAHDPGVTILEHLCYGLSDLLYRTGFPEADILATEDGFSPEAVGMFRPETILPCQPVTAFDLRRHLFDRITGIENLWVLPCKGGLWKIEVNPEPGRDPERLEQEIADEYRAVRNLGEDLAGITILAECPVTLEADIEVDGSRAPDDVMADIWHACHRVVTPGLRPEDPDALLQEGRTLAALFDGPLTRHGILTPDGKMGEKVSCISVVAFTHAIATVPSVQAIRKLHVFVNRRRIDTEFVLEDPASVFSLPLPEAGTPCGIRLFEHGNRVGGRQGFQAGFRAREFSERKPAPHPPASLYTLPEGRRLSFGTYTSIQHHFPDLYGINAFGVPASWPAERRAKAAQLKAYLAIMEQFLANGLETLDRLPRLLSRKVTRTRFEKPLTEAEIPGISPLQREDRRPWTTRERVAELDRQHAILDHLLGLHGESLPKAGIWRDGGYLGERFQQARHLAAKRALHERIPQISSARFQGAPLSGKGRCVSPVQETCELLLGCTLNKSGFLTLPITRDGLKLVSDGDYLAGEPALPLGRDGEALAHLEPISSAPPIQRISCANVMELMEIITPFRRHLLFESLLVSGVHATRYGLVHLDGCQDVTLAFHLGSNWISLGTAENREHGIRTLHLLRRYLIFLNMATEGMHLVEPVLFRGTDDAEPLQRLMILFPDWTDRFANPEFRKIAMETVARRLPAHLDATFHFLGFEKMAAFESRWSRWRKGRGEGIDAGKGVREILGRLSGGTKG